MGTCPLQGWLFLFLLGASSLTLAKNLYCHKGVSVSIEEDPRNTFNWTTGKVETCDNGAFCQESVLLIKAGAKTAVLATKSCISEGTQAITFVQHSPPSGILTISYSNYCEDSLCNNREDLSELLKPEQTPVPNVTTPLHCPTCVALGTCLSAPSLPCPSDTTRCYQGRLQIVGGGINSPLEVKGCTSVTGCRLMSGIFTVGPMWVKEMCQPQSLTQPRKAENGATWLLISVWRLELLLLLLLWSLVHCF
ncbi:PREDICTED: testis-expressed sequence 101 protein [Ceratotherium simum simum]|uniref:Testis-expressed sequence 101 protein n=1 Tax=Ceratotherium simum simum TaxID=73337 RepID=A0ABM1DFM7_CERSS|nr:PREDICTED: testis-expressed sequence 101 protein [Ceratotherium simum simum]